MEMQSVPFEHRHLPAAAKLLAGRHAIDRGRHPQLPDSLTDNRVAENLIATMLENGTSHGICMYRNGEPVGFLLGEYIDNPPDSPTAPYFRQKSVLVRYHGHAAIPPSATRVYHELYRAAARRWVEAGYFAHYIQIPAGNKELDKLFADLGFGRNLGWAFRNIAGRVEAAPPSPRNSIRRANQHDLEAVFHLNSLLEEYESQSPVFLPQPTAAARVALRKEFEESLANPRVLHLLAEISGLPVGWMCLTPPPAHVSPLLTPDRTLNISAVSVLPSERGKGIASLLLNHGLNFAQTEGYERCRMSWMTANPVSSRFWERRGFSSVAWQMSRSVDERSAGR